MSINTGLDGLRSVVAMKVNEIRNADFRVGRSFPRHWSWRSTDETIRWNRDEVDGTMMIRTDSTAAGVSAYWSQSVPCKPDAWYRVEAVVSCELRAPDERSGFVLAVEPRDGNPPASSSRTTPGLHRTLEPIAVRAYFHASRDTRRLDIRVGVVGASGSARIHEVRFIRILEPDEMSHPLAVPPPASHYVPPRVVERVLVCSGSSSARPLTQCLRAFFGPSNVRVAAPDGLRQGRSTWEDAMFLPDASPPKGVRSLSALLALADDRIVVISLPAFASLARRSVRLRRIEQPDDPIHAKVVFSDHATRGFALHDQFAFAWPGDAPGSFVQNQFRRTDSLSAFLKRHRFETLLVSSCDKDSTSDQPICLYRRTRNGGLFVLDVEPVEAPPSTFGEPNLAAHLILSILGRPQSVAGQYAAPLRTETSFREMIREAANRWEHFVVHDDDVPPDRVVNQIVIVGGEDRGYGLPLTPKPVILIRSGLASGDVESVYGVLSWFRQLLRPEPNPCPYAHPLVSRFRLAWVPCPTQWESRDGWRRGGTAPTVPVDLELDGASLAALIDVRSVPAMRARIIYARRDALFREASKWMPRLFERFASDGSFGWCVEAGEWFADRERRAWRSSRLVPQVVADPGAFDDHTHRAALAGGSDVIRIEVPGSDADFVADSIARTDAVVTLLEWTVGLLYGLIAVNRRATPVELDGFPPVAPNAALVVRRAEPAATELWNPSGHVPA